MAFIEMTEAQITSLKSLLTYEQRRTDNEQDESSKNTEVMHFGEITANTNNVKKGMKEMFAKRFGQKISAMIGKSKVSTYGMKQSL